MEITVRSAEVQDAASALAVVRDSISRLCIADHRNDDATLSAWLANKTVENFSGWVTNLDNHCVVAAVGERVAGVGLLHRSGEVRLFYLAPGLQRRGIGRATHHALAAKAGEWGLPRLHLDSTDLARPFYEALGYKPVGTVVSRFGVLRCFPYEKWLRPRSPLTPIV